MGVCAPGELHCLGLLMLLESLRQDGAATTFIGEGKSLTESRDFIMRSSPEMVCISCSLEECVPAAVALVSAVRIACPHRVIIAGGKAAWAARVQLLSVGCFRVFDSRGEACRAIKKMIFPAQLGKIGGDRRELLKMV